MRRRSFKNVARIPDCQCKHQHGSHLPGKCPNCNCGQSERIWPMYGTPIETDNFGSGGRRSRMCVNYTKIY